MRLAKHVKKRGILRVGRGGFGVYREARVPPRRHGEDQAGRDTLPFEKLLQQFLPEENLNEIRIELGQVVKPPCAIEKHLRDDAVEVGIPLEEVAGGVDGEDGARGSVSCGVMGQAFPHGLLDGKEGASRKELQEPPVAEQDPADRLGDPEGPETMRNGQKDLIGNLPGKQEHPLLLAGRAEPGLARKGHQELPPAAGAPDAGEAAFVDPAIDVFGDNLVPQSAPGTVSSREALFVC